MRLSHDWKQRSDKRAPNAAVEDHADPVTFARERLGFDPDAQQTVILRSRTRRGLLNCTRQWGKSTVTAAKAVHRAYTVPKSLILVVSKAQRQSGLWMRKATDFVCRLGIEPRGNGGKDPSLVFPNGSCIIGLPRNESTIRGYSNVAMLLID